MRLDRVLTCVVSRRTTTAFRSLTSIRIVVLTAAVCVYDVYTTPAPMTTSTRTSTTALTAACMSDEGATPENSRYDFQKPKTFILNRLGRLSSEIAVVGNDHGVAADRGCGGRCGGALHMHDDIEQVARADEHWHVVAKRIRHGRVQRREPRLVLSARVEGVLHTHTRT